MVPTEVPTTTTAKKCFEDATELFFSDVANADVVGGASFLVEGVNVRFKRFIQTLSQR